MGSRATLRLTSGSYAFESLTLEPDSVLSLSQPSGPVVLYIRSRWTHRGRVETADGSAPELFIGFFGTAATLERPLAASVLAPNASLALASVGSAGFHGTFFAKRVEVMPDVRVEYRAAPALF